MKVFGAFHCLLLFACSRLNASDSSLAENQTDKDAAPESLAIPEEIMLHMKEVNEATCSILEAVSFLKNNDSGDYETIVNSFVDQLIITKLAEQGVYTMYYLFEALQQTLDAFEAPLRRYKLAPEVTENPFSAALPKKTIDVRPDLKYRAQWVHYQITNATVSDNIVNWADRVHSLQMKIADNLSETSMSYGTTSCHRRAKLLTTIIKLAEYHSENTDHTKWKKALDLVMQHHFEYLRQLYLHDYFSHDMPKELLYSLAKSGAQLNLNIVMNTRAFIFQDLADKEEVVNVLDYMTRRKTTAGIPNVDAKPFTYLMPNMMGLDVLIHMLNSIEHSALRLWPRLPNAPSARTALAQFVLGLQMLKDFMVGGQKSITKSKSGIPQQQLMAILLQVISTANAILFNAVKPYIADSNKSLIEPVLKPARGSPHKLVKIRTLESTYAIIEATLALFFKTDPEYALMLFHFLELTRGILYLPTKIQASFSTATGKKPVNEQDGVVGLHANDSMIVYEDSYDFIAEFTLKFPTMLMTEFGNVLHDVTDIVKTFLAAYASAIFPDGLTTEFYIFVNRRIKENPKLPVYKSLKGKITSEMMKDKPAAVVSEKSKISATAPKKKKQVATKKKQKPNQPKQKKPQQVEPPTADPNEPAKEGPELLDIKLTESKTVEDLEKVEKVGDFKDRVFAAVTSKPKKAVKALTKAVSKPVKAIEAISNPTKAAKLLTKSTALTNASSNPIKNVKSSSNPTKMLGHSKSSKGTPPSSQKQYSKSLDGKSRFDMAKVVQAQMPSWIEESLHTKLKVSKTKLITNRIIERYEEPTHYTSIAEDLGFIEGKIDPRDYLMALILVGERIKRNKLEPLLTAFQSSQSTQHLYDLFYKSMDKFEEKVMKLSLQEPEVLKPALKAAGLTTAQELITCLKYYKMRNMACHPKVPRSDIARRNLMARHLTTLDILQSYDTELLCRLRHHLECYDEIFLRSIETETGRPRNIYSPQYTEKSLAIIGLMECFDFAALRIDRNLAAHKYARDEKYAAYIDYVFADSPNYEFLKHV